MLAGLDDLVAEAFDSRKWVPARFHDRFETCYADLVKRRYTFFTLDPVCGTPLTRATLPKRSAFILGHEAYGVSDHVAAHPDIRPLTIPQFGQVQSLNVSIAASIVMWEYLRQHPLNTV